MVDLGLGDETLTLLLCIALHCTALHCRLGVIVPVSMRAGDRDANVNSSRQFQFAAFDRIVEARDERANGSSGDEERSATRTHAFAHAEAQMALANQEIHDSKRLASIRTSSLISPLSTHDKQLVSE